MQLPATFDDAKNSVTVAVPITRSDILHACDVAEDVAIAYGFNNIPKRLPATLTTGKEQPINLLTDLLRPEIAFAGFTETLTLALCSQEETFEFMNREDDGNTAVILSNPMTVRRRRSSGTKDDTVGMVYLFYLKVETIVNVLVDNKVIRRPVHTHSISQH